MTRDILWKGVLAIVVLAAVAFAARQLITLSRRARPVQPVPKVDLICTECGKETTAAVRDMPMKCPACGKRSLVLSAYCRQCGTTLPLLDSAAYLASPQQAMTHAAQVLPKCPKCGRLMPPKFVVSPGAPGEP
ncbi:MAG: hypothetical protein V2A58_14020 [Planctomycetota bacterium]